MNILYVCAGNTCRSPMAQYYSQGAFPGDKFRSRGLYGSGGPMSPGALEVLGQDGLDGRGHVSQTLQEEDLAWADWIVPMTRDIQDQLRGLCGNKVFGFWDQGGSEIPDPYGGDGTIYQITYDLLKKNIHLMMETLEG